MKAAPAPKRSINRPIAKINRVGVAVPVTGTPLSVAGEAEATLAPGVAEALGEGEALLPPVPPTETVNVELAVSVVSELGSSPVTVTVYVPFARSVVVAYDHAPCAFA